MDSHPLGFTAGGERHKFILYYMKKENIVETLLISSSFSVFLCSRYATAQRQRNQYRYKKEVFNPLFFL